MKKFLIVVDMQNDFIDGALGTKEAQGIVDKVLKKILSFEGTIIATMDTHQNDYMDSSEGKFLPIPHCIRGTEGWKIESSINEALNTRGNYTVIEKPTFGSVHLAKRMSELLSDVGKDAEIQLVGLCTDICVVSNALLLKAYLPEAEIVVDSDCCAGVTPEKHEAALETMRSCQIKVI